jgi:hypothetical protein
MMPKMLFRASNYCWVIKTIEGGPGNIDHWDNFQNEAVVAVGWQSIRDDPMSFDSFEAYFEHLSSKKYRWNCRHAASTIYKFAKEWQDGDIALICTGYAPNQTKDVYLYGIAEGGSYFFDGSSKWWRFKRHAKIMPVEQYVPVDLMRKIFGGSLMQTIHGPFTKDQFEKLIRKVNVRYDTRRIRASRGIERVSLPEEVQDAGIFPEGAVRQIIVNAYERNSKARRECIAHYGATCFICGLNFAERYGDAGEGFIQVHHLKQLSDIGRKYKVNPIIDLRPVCPNCHAVIHRRRKAYSIKQMKSFLRNLSEQE